MTSAISTTSSYSFASFSKPVQQNPQERFALADADGSGALSLEEYQSFAPDFVDDIEGSFNQIDSNGDGQLTEDELKSFAESQGQRPPPPPSEANSISSYLETLLLEESEANEELFSALDTDVDGEISSDELRAAVDDIEASFTSILLGAQESYLS